MQRLDAYLYFMQGLDHHHDLSGGSQSRAQELFGKALAIDPKFASAHAFLGYSYIKQARNNWVKDTARATGR